MRTRSRSNRTAAGGRPDALLGAWSIEPVRFKQMYDLAVAVDLAALAERHAGPARATGRHVGPAEDEDPGYTLLGNGVAYVAIHGPMSKATSCFEEMFGGASTVRVRRAVRLAGEDPNVKGLVVEYDTPGGTVAGTAQLSAELACFRLTKPLVSWIPDLCCSAGYWCASQADHIVCGPTACVGNIGAYAVLEDTTGEQAQRGVKFRVVSTGPYKGLGADGAVTEELVADLQRELDVVHELFVDSVAAGREMDRGVAATVSDGRAHVGRDAVRLDLADQVGSFDDAIAYLDQLISAAAPGNVPAVRRVF